MILKSIELKNIRSYDHAKIEFPLGITLFEGDIGSGKSTVLMAVEFSLFGLGSQKPESLLSKKKDEGYTILNFEVDDKQYEIKRKLKRKRDSITQESKSCYLINDGEMEPLTASELKQRILQILRFNEPSSPNSTSRIYRYAVFTPQEEMKLILRDVNTRLETIRRAFGIEDYKIAIENTKNMLSTIKTNIAVYKKGFSNLDELKKHLEKSENEKRIESLKISNLEKQLEVLEKKRSAAAEAIEDARKRQMKKIELYLLEKNKKQAIENNTTHINTILREIHDKKQEIQDIDDRIGLQKKITKPTFKNLTQIDDEIGNIEKLNNSITVINSKIDNITEDMSGLVKELGLYNNLTTQDLHNRLDEFNNLLTKLSNESKDIMNLIASKEKEKARLEERKQYLESKLDGISNIGSKCPICDSILTKEHIINLEKERRLNFEVTIKHIEQLETENKNNSIIRENLEKEISKKMDEFSKIKSAVPLIKKYDEKKLQVSRLQLEVQKLVIKNVIQEEMDFPNNNRFKDPLSYMKALRDALIQFTTAEEQIKNEEIRQKNLKSRLEKIVKEKIAIEEEISRLQGQLKSISNSLIPLEDIDNILHKAEEVGEAIHKKIKKLNNDLSTTTERKRHLTEEICRLKDEISHAEKDHEKFIKFNNCLIWLNDFFIPALEQTEKQVLHSVQYNFNLTYQNWFSTLIDDPTKQSRIDENFSPIVEQDGYEQEIDYLSGGEKTSISLAYRLTLNSMIRHENESLKSNLLILDEPTDGFSKTQLLKIKDILKQLDSEQIILVSHEKELETYADNIYCISKDSGVSHVYLQNN